MKGFLFCVGFLMFCSLTNIQNHREVTVIKLEASQDESKKTRLLYFGATWCTPCKITKRNLQSKEVKAELSRFDVVYYDVDEDKKEKEKYKIKYIPTIIFEKDEKVTDRYTGGQSKEQLLKILKKH